VGTVEVLYVCSSRDVVERLKSAGVEAEAADFDLPEELLEAAGVLLPERAAGGRFEVVVRAPLEKFPEIKRFVNCRPASYRIEVRCATEECIAKVVAVLSKYGSSVYVKEYTVYGFGEGGAKKIVAELTAGRDR